MKNILFPAIAGILISASVHAQSTVDSIEAKYKLLPMPQGISTEKAFPALGTYQLNAPVSPASTTDNSGATSSTTASGGTVVITMDSSSKGIVWIDGLPEGRMKAYLKKSPATYRIVPQVTSTGKQIPEGTMIYSPDNNTLNISIGAPFNDADPSAIFAMNNPAAATDATATTDMNAAPTGHVKVKTKAGTTKTKNKVMYYTASKSLTSSSSNAAQQ